VGTSLSKTFDVKQEFTMEDSEIKVNGTLQQKPEDVEMAMSMRTRVALTDLYASVEGGQVTRIERSFDTLSGSGNMSMDMGAFGSQTRDLTLESELEGRTRTPRASRPATRSAICSRRWSRTSTCAASCRRPRSRSARAGRSTSSRCATCSRRAPATRSGPRRARPSA
jgi:hypothetical protein